MKLRCYTLIIGLFFAVCIFAQPNQSKRLFFPFLNLESQTNIVVVATWEHPQVCSMEYTNLISNTNLFSVTDQKLFQEITLKYRGVATNQGPVGTVFKETGFRQWKAGKLIKIFPIVCFVYTNSAAQEEIAFSDRAFFAKYRTQQGDGYDVQFIDGSLNEYQEYKNGVLDGLCTIFGGNVNHCNIWARFVKGKIVGKFIMWGEDGLIRLEAEFNTPFDYLKNQTVKFDLAWTEVPTNSTGSAQSSKWTWTRHANQSTVVPKKN